MPRVIGTIIRPHFESLEEPRGTLRDKINYDKIRLIDVNILCLLIGIFIKVYFNP